MADIELTTDATIGANTSISVTVYEDTDQDGTAENTATQTIDDGTNTYTLSGFSGGTGNDYWHDIEPDNSDITATASINSISIDTALSGAQTVAAGVETITATELAVDVNVSLALSVENVSTSEPGISIAVGQILEVTTGVASAVGPGVAVQTADIIAVSVGTTTTAEPAITASPAPVTVGVGGGALTATEPAVGFGTFINASVDTATTVQPSLAIRVAGAQTISLSAETATIVEPALVTFDETGWTAGNTVREDDALAITDIRLTHDRLTLSWTSHVSAVDRVRSFREHAGDVTQVVDSDGSWEALDRSNDNNAVTIKPPRPLRPPLVADDYVVESYRERGGDGGLVRDIQVRLLRQSPRSGSSSLAQSAGSDEWEFAFSDGTVATSDVEVGDPGPQGDVEFRLALDADQTEAVLASLTRLEAVSVESVPDGDDFVRDNAPNNENTVTINRPSSLGSEYLPDEGDYVVRDMTVRREEPTRWRVELTARKT